MSKKPIRPRRFPDSCVIEPSVHLFGSVNLAEKVWLEPNVTVYGPVTIGEGTYVGANCVIGFPQRKELDEMQFSMNHRPRFSGSLTSIGESVQLRSNCTLYSDVTVGNRVRFGHNVMVREAVVIGKESTVGTGTVIDGNCRIGEQVSIQSNVYVSTNTIIEDQVFLGPCCVLANDKYMAQAPYDLKGPVIRKGASIGANAIILPDVDIGEGAVVGAGSVVTRDVPSRVIVVGVPALKLKDVPTNWGIK